VPGANPPTAMVSDEIRRPTGETCHTRPVPGLTTAAAIAVVRSEPESMGCPHARQNRSVADTSAEHERHVNDMGDPVRNHAPEAD
jgi:hypothetical protein